MLLSIDYLLGMAGWLLVLAASFFGCLALRRHWKTRPKRLWIANAALSAWMLVAFLTGIELVFALTYDQSDSFNMTNVSRRWFERHVQLNQRGFRDEPFRCELPVGTRRILFAGDSFTFGHGVQRAADRFSDRVGAALEARHRDRFAVANLGRPGLDLDGLIRMLDQDIFDADCDVEIVVYSICLNDIETYDPDNHRVYERLGGLQPRFVLFRNTYFFNMLYFRAKQYTAPEVHSYFEHVARYYNGPPWQEMQRKLDELHGLCERNNVDLRIAIFPFLHNLGPDYPFRAAHRQLVEYCRSHQIPVLDLEPVLAPHSAEGLTVNRFDAHPNARAHGLAAAAMQEKLLRDLFEPRESGR